MNKNNIILYFLSNYKKEVFLLCILFGIFSLFETLALGSFYPLLKSVMQGESLASDGGVVLKFIEHVVGMIPIADRVISSSLLLAFFAFTSALIGFASDYLAKYYQFKISEDYINKTYDILLHKEADFFVEKKQGELTYIGMNTSSAVGELFHYLPKTAIELLRVVLIIAFLMTMSVKATIGLLGFLFLSGSGYLILTTKFIYPLAVKLQKSIEEQTSLLVESVQGAGEIQVYRAIPYFLSRYAKIVETFTKDSITSAAYTILPKHVGNVAVIALICTVVIVLKVFFPSTYVSSLSIFVVYLISLQKMVTSVMNIGNNWTGLKNLAPRLELLMDHMDSEIVTDNSTDASKSLTYGQIDFKDVKFSYGEGKPILSGINLEIKKNSVVAFVGPSGAGKTTVMNLLTGAYYPQFGEVHFGQTPLSQETVYSIRRNIAIVPQYPFLFNASVFENIRLSNPKATLEEVISAAKSAAADEFISQLPDGYNTPIGDRGALLSGGQRQRIAIARALLKNPEFLFLDEATSALDNISEQKIRQVLQDLSGKLTVVMVAHRLTTIEHADNIFVLESGRVVESGTHKELLAKGGPYLKLYNSSI